ncbi:MAG TPA: 2,3-diaminopropionate biosynthesis protein SbnB [Pyrinomonadaceae bacterium]|nr:2,3-diaminopropionate biosynthesis protein SbnB [Pyrinomonadaceae bacterium]
MLILKGAEVQSLLATREAEVMDIVRRAYLAHAAGQSSLPHSNFLRFPEDPSSRIIALPAYLGAEFSVAGIKWISSFPRNLNHGADRASAVLILNSVETGHPVAVMESSIISAKRTAASAALAARYLQGASPATCAGLIGTGLISFEIARFLTVACPEIEKFVVFDIDAKRAEFFKQRVWETLERVDVEVVFEIGDVLSHCPLIAFATTAGVPHVADVSRCAPGSTILHISLRDLAPEITLSASNIVDDADHACRAQTSLHLAEQLAGSRDFIRGTLADVINGDVAPRTHDDEIVIFSPFGLGVLDIAVGSFVRDLALSTDLGMALNSFLPEPWTQRSHG